jgi:chorismate synthase
MSSFGRIFRITTFGESHGKGVGVIVENVPPGMKLSESDIQPQLSRRRPGQSALTTARDEADQVVIQSGVENGKTLGTPLSLFVANLDQRPGDYKSMSNVPRPSHADYTYQMKYGLKASSGGGRASARETIGRVAAGAVAEKWLKERFGIEIVAWVSSIHTIDMNNEVVKPLEITREMVDKSAVRCPDLAATELMAKAITEAKAANDSIGGVVTCVCRNVPPGWGEPCFDKLEALLAHAMLSIPATKGFEIGSGFSGSRMMGSQHNDMFVKRPDGKLGTVTNNSGGIQGGISNGEPVMFRVAFKPAATISRDQPTATYEGDPAVLQAKGRHDPCVVPRAISIVETMAALVLADTALIQMSRQSSVQYEDNEADLL